MLLLVVVINLPRSAYALATGSTYHNEIPSLLRDYYMSVLALCVVLFLSADESIIAKAV